MIIITNLLSLLKRLVFLLTIFYRLKLFKYLWDYGGELVEYSRSN